MQSNSSLKKSLYTEQALQWPKSGRHILAQFDSDSVFVYQAYRPAIARYAVENQKFGGEFSFNRMSWIKPNFLWMMYRSGWATKEGQEHILAIRLSRKFFDELLSSAVASTFDSRRYSDRDEWQAAVGASEVRLQWDPDHGPSGQPVERRAIQLGLRGTTLRRFGNEEAGLIEDITEFVIEQRELIHAPYTGLLTPKEHIYQPSDPKAALRVGL